VVVVISHRLPEHRTLSFAESITCCSARRLHLIRQVAAESHSDGGGHEEQGFICFFARRQLSFLPEPFFHWGRHRLPLYRICGGGYYYAAPPPPPASYYYAPPVAPAVGYTWVPGYYYPSGPRWAWRTGYWARPPYVGARWVSPRYYGGRYYGGYWRR